jgi:hypothetical protein
MSEALPKMQPHWFEYNWLFPDSCRQTIMFVGKEIPCGLPENDPVHRPTPSQPTGEPVE